MELRAQIRRVKEAGLEVSHLDSHQHLHMLPGILPIVARLAREFGIGAIRYPYQRGGEQVARGWRRRLEAAGLRSACRLARGPYGGLGASALRTNGLVVCDGFRGFGEAGAWDSASLARAISGLGQGVTEICCHPGVDDSIAAQFPWGYRWETELAALTSEELASAIRISGVQLTSYREMIAQQPR